MSLIGKLSSSRNLKSLYLAGVLALVLPSVSNAQVGASPNGGIVIQATPYINGSGIVRGVIKCTDGSASTPCYTFASDTTKGWYNSGTNEISASIAGTRELQIAFNGVSAVHQINSATGFGLNSALGATSDVVLARDAANTLALRNGTNNQTFNVYNTTDGTNKEYVTQSWQSNNFIIRTIAAGTGTLRNIVLDGAALRLYSSGTERWDINSSGHLLAFADNTYDIGASGATRPRSIYVGTKVRSAVFETSTALITTVDGGSTASFTANMIASTGGPTTATQNGWVKMQDSTGATIWVPVWK